jgi:hypothetical protein
MIGDLPNMEITNDILREGLFHNIMKREGLGVNRNYVNIDINKSMLPKYSKFILKIKYYDQYIYGICNYDGNMLMYHTYSINLENLYL